MKKGKKKEKLGGDGWRKKFGVHKEPQTKTTMKREKGEEGEGWKNVLGDNTHVTDVVLEIHNGSQLVGREVRLFSDHNKNEERKQVVSSWCLAQKV